MINGLFSPNFGKTLKYLYITKGIDTDNAKWSGGVAKEMYDNKILTYSDETDKTPLQQQNDFARQLRKHIEQKDPPSAKWLLRYQKYFSCSVDFLLGIIDKPNHDIKQISDVTGLSDEAIQKLSYLQGIPYFSDVISTLIEHHNCEYYLSLLRARFSSIARDKSKYSNITEVEIYGESARIETSGLLDSVFSSHIVQDLPYLSEAYIKVLKRKQKRYID